MPKMNRREALAAVGAGLVTAAWRSAVAAEPSAGGFRLPKLPYAYDALEPAIDARTMELHHTKHHAAYVAGLNKALEGAPELAGQSLDWLLGHLSEVPEKVRAAVRNHGGGHANHSLFWESLVPGGSRPAGALAPAVASAWPSFEAFQSAFGVAATTRFGSGWAWLVLNPRRQLAVYSLPNQDSPLSQGDVPLLGLDVWEHAYYLKYQNRRADYLAAWWSVVNWPVVAARYAAALKP